MLFEFQAEDGEIREVYGAMADAIPAGQSIEIDGKRFTRIYSRTHIDPSPSASIYFRAHNLPLNYKYAQGLAKFDEEGVPVFTSRRALDETLAKANDQGENWLWNP